MKQKSEFLVDSLHIFVLFSFALVQPLFDLLSRNAVFFVARHSEPVDVILLVLVLLVLLPSLVVLVEVVAGLLGRRFRKGIHAFVVAGLVACIVLPALKMHLGEIPGTALLGVAAFLGAAFAITYMRFRPVRMFLTVLSPAVLLFPGLFLFNSPVSRVILEDNYPNNVHTKLNATAPIVMIVFDELPVTALMDEFGKIDSIRYPNFADLARKAIWFRNASTVSISTTDAVPAILDGKYPYDFRLPAEYDHPHNIFTLLGRSYQLKVFESRTQLCPERLCESSAAREGLAGRMSSLLSDLFIVYLHIVLPSNLSSILPVISQDWSNFTANTLEVNEDEKNAYLLGKWLKEVYKALPLTHPQDRYQQFLQFINTIHFDNKPTFYFLHILLPHYPYNYLPSGKIYTTDKHLDGLTDDIWGDDERLAMHAYHRYLLQVGFVDTLLGKLIARLKEVGLYNSSLIIVTADHGSSFRPNDHHREVTKTNYYDIIYVPLFIKEPNQLHGWTSDRNVETIDILPTIADILGIHLPWPMDGRSALDLSLPERTTKVIFTGDTSQKRFQFSPIFEVQNFSLEQKLSRFGSGGKPNGLFNIGSHDDLIGRHVSEFRLTEATNVTVELDQAIYYERVDPESAFVPSYITGRAFSDEDTLSQLYLAVAVNGTIRAVTQTFGEDSNIAKFSAIVPETAFQAGKNHVEILVVSGVGSSRHLKRLQSNASVTYSLAASSKQVGDTITSSNGASIPVIPNTLTGYLGAAIIKGDFVKFAGWAADVKNFQLPEAILIFVDGEFFYSGRTNVDRPDVVKAYGNLALESAGFRYTLPLGSFRNIANSEVRVFALSKNGVASELKYPNGNQLKVKP